MAATPVVEFATGAAAPTRFGPAFVGIVVVVSLLAAMTAPLSLLVLGPLALGVPHVIGDVRTLWLQRPGGIADRVVLCALAPLCVMTALRAAAAMGFAAPAWLEVALGATAIGIGAQAGARGANAKRIVAALAVALGLVLCAFPFATTIGLAHAHNAIAFCVWAAWARHRAGTWIAAACYVAAWGVALLWPIDAHAVSGDAFGMTSLRAASSLAPGLDGAAADALVRSFVFAQLVHYGLWTFSLPSLNAQRRVASADRLLLVVAVVACAIVPIAGAFHPLGMRDSYLSLSVFHGWLELAIVAFLIAQRATGAKR